MSEKSIHDGHRKRMRESFLTRDFDTVPDHEILEILLFYAHTRKDTNELAHRLINAFGNLESVLSAPYEELVKINGIGESAAVLINLFSKLAVRYVSAIDDEATIKTDDEIIRMIVNRLANEPKEKVLIALLDRKRKLINITEVATGGIDDASFRPRALLEPIFRCGATRVVIAHNHPQGFAVPSMADVETTQTIKGLLRPLEVLFDDHIIVSGKDWYSMKSNKKYEDFFQKY